MRASWPGPERIRTARAMRRGARRKRLDSKRRRPRSTCLTCSSDDRSRPFRRRSKGVRFRVRIGASIDGWGASSKRFRRERRIPRRVLWRGNARPTSPRARNVIKDLWPRSGMSRDDRGDGDFVILHGRFSGFGGPGELDRGRHLPHRGRDSRRALGRDLGRSDAGAVPERPSHVRDTFPK
jgi:hypothetical protein